MIRTTVFALLLAAVSTGCGSTKTYQLEVTNQSPRPVTLWLTKDGPPPEDGWRSPEELASLPPDREPGYDFVIVDPGRTGFTDPVKGEFPAGTRAVLRVYDGTPNYLDMAKAGKTERAEHVLKPGNNRLTIVDDAGKLTVRRK